MHVHSVEREQRFCDSCQTDRDYVILLRARCVFRSCSARVYSVPSTLPFPVLLSLPLLFRACP